MDVNSSTPSRRPPRLGRRLGNACTECRRKKLRCDHNHPCSNCQRSRRGTCSYEDNRDAVVPQRTQPRVPTTPSTSTPEAPVTAEVKTSAVTSVAANDTESTSSKQNNNELWHESELGSVLVAQDSPLLRSAADAGGVVGENESHHEAPALEVLSHLTTPVRAILIKSRYLLASHWIFASTLHPSFLKWLNREILGKTSFYKTLQDCKAYARALKAQRNPRREQLQFGQQLPQAPVMQKLLELYLRTFETVHRVLHVPTLVREYAALTHDPNSATTQFIIQLQLCLALGACSYDHDFSLRQQAMQWIREAEDWLNSTSQGSKRPSMAKMQIVCLLHLARQATGPVWGDRVWISSSSLVPSAMAMGLHRDPSTLPPMSGGQAELRRRLWATVLELSLDAALDAGQPILLCLDDFDCQLPSNFNDNQLNFESSSNPPPLADDQFTQTSVPIAISRSFSIRFTISKYLSRLAPPESYDEALSLSARLRDTASDLVSGIRRMRPEVPLFQRHYSQMVVSRFIFALHLPLMPLPDPHLCIFRNVCIETALSVCYLTLPAKSIHSPDSPIQLALASSATHEQQCPDFTRLSVCASGLLRSTTRIALCVLSTELYSIAVDKSMFKASRTLRIAELRLLLRAGLEWTEKRLRAGQSNVKDYVFSSVAVAELDALLREEDSEESVAKYGAEAAYHARAIMAELAGSPNQMNEATESTVDSGQLSLDDELWSSWVTDYSNFGWVNYGTRM